VDSKDRRCPFIEKCHFFNNLNLGSLTNALKKEYCKREFEKCARYRLHNSGDEVPFDLWPDGIRTHRKISSS
jgi:hypothetical protein